MSAISLKTIRQRVTDLAAVIGAPACSLPTYGHTEEGARPHVEADDPLMHYVVVERGEELLRETFTDLDGLLERVFRDVARAMASDFELKHRHPNEDCRRQLFAKQLEYLAALNPAWAERARLNAVLAEHPFSDGLEPRDTVDVAGS